MMKTDFDYTHADIVSALKKVGIKKGDIVFSHVGIGFLGFPKEGGQKEAVQSIIKAFKEVLGPTGTFLVPTYTYSFCNGEDYDARSSPSTVGYFTEVFRKQRGVTRSREPNFSVAGIGPKVKTLFKNLPMDSFGPDCLYDRLTKMNATICNIGVGFRYATYVHYTEQSASVPYRFMKVFKGNIIERGGKTPQEISYYVRTTVDNEDSMPDLSRLENDARRAGALHEAPLGRSVVSHISCRDFYDSATRGIRNNPWYLAEGFTKHR